MGVGVCVGGVCGSSTGVGVCVGGVCGIHMHA